MRKSFLKEFALLWVLLALVSDWAGQAVRAGEATVVLENRTYSPLHYRATTAQGSRLEWKVLLPGDSAENAAERMRGIEVWFNDTRTEHYHPAAGSICAWKRRSPRGSPEFIRCWERHRQAPAPPHRPLYGDDPFGPLERFITQCEEQKHDYRLSLKDLARACAAAQKKGALPEELRFVRGFTWFFGYMIDDEKQDVILLGIKDPSRPPIDVDSLATVINAVATNNVPLCSLDPHPDPRYHKSVVEGVPWKSRFAEVMIKADYDMGRTFAGLLQPSIPGFKTQLEHLEDVLTTLGDAPEGGSGFRYDRWWFNFNSDVARAVADPSGKLLYLHTNPVRLSTERSVNSKFGTGTQSESAVRFAEQFTRHLDALGKEYPSISELQCLFRLYDLMRHVREAGQTPVPELDYWAKQYQHAYAGPPETMPAWPKQTRTIRTRKDAPRFVPGSTFIGTETWGKNGLRSDWFRFDLFTGGRVTMQGVEGTKYGTWEAAGGLLTLRFSSGRAVYVGTHVENGVFGMAESNQGTWTWKTDRGYETWLWTSGRQ